MKFSDKIEEDGKSFWKDAMENRLANVINTCVEKIDELERTIREMGTEIADLQIRCAMRTPTPTPVPIGLSDRDLDSIVATMNALVERGAFDKNSNGNGNHG